MTGYAELQVTTNYSFLRGASHSRSCSRRQVARPAGARHYRSELAGRHRARASARGRSRHAVGGGMPARSHDSCRCWSIRLTAPRMRGCAACCRSASRAGKGAATSVAGSGGAWRRPAGRASARRPGCRAADASPRLRADFRDRGYLALTLRRRPGDAVRLACWPTWRRQRVATV